MAYYLKVRPHEEENMHRIEMFNEAMLLASIYFLPLYTEYVKDPEMRYNFGWYFNSCLIVPLIGVNLAHTFFISVRRTWLELR